MKRRWLIIFVVVLCFMYSEACKNKLPTGPDPPDPPDSQQLEVGDYAENFTAVDQNDQNVSLSSYFGKVILINFSADYCPACQAEATHLEALFQLYKDQGFVIITLFLQGSISTWAQQYGLTFPVLDDSSYAVWNKYGDTHIPLNIIIDRGMTIQYKKAGYNEGEIKREIEKYL